MSDTQLSFKVSTALKDIIGKDLISDKYIAIFELVKNSYDALAKRVTITFHCENGVYDSISIVDDGIGMCYSDIINKWLFVAYSEKKEKNRTETYRENISRSAAGAKGVGRFSCDRLGSKLEIITKTEADVEFNRLQIDWNKFEKDDENKFEEVSVDYETLSEEKDIEYKGTKLVVRELREEWNRADILKLKKALMKLINPEVENDEFKIFISSPNDRSADEKVKLARDRVNGEIINDVFETLNIKTTNIKVNISETGEIVTTELYDRGEFIFSIKERNVDYPYLHNISVSLFYLNQVAKYNFTKIMGLHNVRYGSVFVYKNGFRVMPYGEPGDDFFNIDRRKSQGYARYFGTREILGRISIKGENKDFVETSSRAHGFVFCPAVEELNTFFVKRVLSVLERYVVNIISWGEPLKKENGRVIQPDEVADKILATFASYARKGEIIDVRYNEKILRTQRSDNSPSIVQSIEELENVAQKSQNEAILKLAKDVKKRTQNILKNNIELEKINRENEKKIDEVERINQSREKQVFFLKGLNDKQVVNLVNGMHSVFTLSEVVRGNIENIKNVLDKEKIDQEKCFFFLNEMYKSVVKINKLSELAIKGNQSLKQTGLNSLYDFMCQYVQEQTTKNSIDVIFADNEKAVMCRFDTTSVGIIIDNVISNSIKAGAEHLFIDFIEEEKNVKVIFSDDGVGLPAGIDEKMIFEMGMTSNREGKGFGIGLSHIKLLVEEMGGSININKEVAKGFELEMRLRK